MVIFDLITNLEIINVILLFYIAVLETLSVYRQFYPKKRKYNKRPTLKVIKGKKYEDSAR